MFSLDNDCIILLKICKIYCRFQLNEPVLLSLKTTYPLSDEIEHIFNQNFVIDVIWFHFIILYDTRGKQLFTATPTCIVITLCWNIRHHNVLLSINTPLYTPIDGWAEIIPCNAFYPSWNWDLSKVAFAHIYSNVSTKLPIIIIFTDYFEKSLLN